MCVHVQTNDARIAFQVQVDETKPDPNDAYMYLHVRKTPMLNKTLTCVEDDVIMTITVTARVFLTGLGISTRVTSVWIRTVARDVSTVLTGQ